MIADTVEAASRAVGNYEDPEDFRKFVHSLIKGKMDTNQFSDCPITFKELSIIEDTLVEAVPSCIILESKTIITKKGNSR